jgi:hypothetical protein
MRPPVPFIPLLITCVGLLLSIRLLNNAVARFLDYWMPTADRRVPRLVVKTYTVLATASAIFLGVGALLYKLKAI